MKKWHFGKVFKLLRTFILEFLITSGLVVAHWRLKLHQKWFANYKQMHYHEEETVGNEYEENENTLGLSDRRKPHFSFIRWHCEGNDCISQETDIDILKIFIQHYMMWCITQTYPFT